MEQLNKKIWTVLFAITCSMSAYAQMETTVNGLGRAILTNNKLSGNVLEGDSLTPSKGLSGYNLFDLSYNFQKNREFRANTVVRVRQPWGEFWGEETQFEFRQLQLMGDLNWLSYEIGDIDFEMSPYTLYNPDELFNDYESDIFSARRDIVEYENFNKDNVWRLQGVKLGTGAYLDKSFAKELLIKGYGSRTNISNDINLPDRILAGGTVNIKNAENKNINLNYIGLLDVALDNFATNYRNNVFTLNTDYAFMEKDSMSVSLVAEGGISDNDYYRLTDDSTYKANDYFFDAGIKTKLKNGLKLQVSYKNVGLRYSSPSAQTRRIDVAASSLLFAKVLDNTTDRNQILFDRFTQEQIYNRGINPVLNSFVPFYNNVMPYGEATPNRTGITLDIQSGKSEKIEFSLKARSLSEITGEGSTAKRSFLSGQGGVRIGLSEFIGFEKPIKISLGGRYEKTDRSDGSVDLSSILLDAGLSINLTDKIDFLGGMKMLTGSGTEVIGLRNDLNMIKSYISYDIDLSENITSLGLRFSFNESTNFLVNYNIITLTDNKTSGNSYSMNQLFMNFNVMF